MSRASWRCVVVLSVLATVAASEAAAVEPPDLGRLLGRTGSIVEGTVSKVSFTYSDASGPWTVVTLADTRTLAGVRQPARFEIRQQGGPLPSGKLLVVEELPIFAVGSRYVVFLRNARWSDTPVVSRLALRVAVVSGREVLVNQEQRPLVGVTARGLMFGPRPLFDPVPDLYDNVLQGRPPAAVKAFISPDLSQCVGRAALSESLTREIRKRGVGLKGDAPLQPVLVAWRRPAKTAAERARR